MLDEVELTGDRDEGGAAGRAWLPHAMSRELLWLYLLWIYLLWLYLLWHLGLTAEDLELLLAQPGGR